MAEIEHFVNPEKRQIFPKFSNVADLHILFYSACDQMDGKPPKELSLREAVGSVRGRGGKEERRGGGGGL